jgi:hypothetical protein
MRLGSVRAHLGLLSAVAVLLGLLLFVVFWLDHPFRQPAGCHVRTVRAVAEERF